MTRSFALWTAIFALFLPASIHASPITYDFNGRFATPVDGATAFTGSFTYDTNLPIASGTSSFPGTAFYGDNPATPGKLISMSFEFGSTSSSDLGPISKREMIVSHNSAYDEINLDVTFTNGGKDSMFVIGMLNDNTTSPGPFSSTAPPTSLTLSSFNMGVQFIDYPNIASSDASVIGWITGLVPAGTPLPPIPAVPEPTTCVVILAGFGGLLLRRHKERNQPELRSVRLAVSRRET